jgi:hypothetical protein
MPRLSPSVGEVSRGALFRGGGESIGRIVSLVQQRGRLWSPLRFSPHDDSASGAVSVIIHIVN